MNTNNNDIIDLDQPAYIDLDAMSILKREQFLEEMKAEREERLGRSFKSRSKAVDANEMYQMIHESDLELVERQEGYKLDEELFTPEKREELRKMLRKNGVCLTYK